MDRATPTGTNYSASNTAHTNPRESNRSPVSGSKVSVVDVPASNIPANPSAEEEGGKSNAQRVIRHNGKPLKTTYVMVGIVPSHIIKDSANIHEVLLTNSLVKEALAGSVFTDKSRASEGKKMLELICFNLYSSYPYLDKLAVFYKNEPFKFAGALIEIAIYGNADMLVASEIDKANKSGDQPFFSLQDVGLPSVLPSEIRSLIPSVIACMWTCRHLFKNSTFTNKLENLFVLFYEIDKKKPEDKVSLSYCCAAFMRAYELSSTMSRLKISSIPEISTLLVNLKNNKESLKLDINGSGKLKHTMNNMKQLLCFFIERILLNKEMDVRSPKMTKEDRAKETAKDDQAQSMVKKDDNDHKKTIMQDDKDYQCIPGRFYFDDVSDMDEKVFLKNLEKCEVFHTRKSCYEFITKVFDDLHLEQEGDGKSYASLERLIKVAQMTFCKIDLFGEEFQDLMTTTCQVAFNCTAACFMKDDVKEGENNCLTGEACLIMATSSLGVANRLYFIPTDEVARKLYDHYSSVMFIHEYHYNYTLLRPNVVAFINRYYSIIQRYEWTKNKINLSTIGTSMVNLYKESKRVWVPIKIDEEPMENIKQLFLGAIDMSMKPGV